MTEQNFNIFKSSLCHWVHNSIMLHGILSSLDRTPVIGIWNNFTWLNRPLAQGVSKNGNFLGNFCQVSPQNAKKSNHHINEKTQIEPFDHTRIELKKRINKQLTTSLKFLPKLFRIALDC